MHFFKWITLYIITLLKINFVCNSNCPTPSDKIYWKVNNTCSFIRKKQKWAFGYMLLSLNADPDYCSKIIWTDKFLTAEIFIRKNQYRRKKMFKQIKKSGRKTGNVWCGIFKNKVVGSIFYDYNCPGVVYFLLRLLQVPIRSEHPDYNDLVHGCSE